MEKIDLKKFVRFEEGAVIGDTGENTPTDRTSDRFKAWVALDHYVIDEAVKPAADDLMDSLEMMCYDVDIATEVDQWGKYHGDLGHFVAVDLE